MSKKFIPDSDVDFAAKARNFAQAVAGDPERFHIPSADAQAIAEAVAAFAQAHQANQQRHTRSSATAMRKNETRELAERLIRKAANLIRLNEQISTADKVIAGVREKPTQLRKRECPRTPPVLQLMAHRSGWQMCSSHHRIRFADFERMHSEAKPEGAARLELFVSVIPAGEPIPDAPSPCYGAHPMYLRSYSRSPITVDYPKFSGMVQVLYWGRWASATGETGPFSRTLAVAVEPVSTQSALPDRTGRAEQTVLVTTVRRELPDHATTIDPQRIQSTRLPEPSADAA
jgi:hypothetical protein